MAELLFMRPPQSDRSLSDMPERERALDTTRSWIVEAPAGSGKTGLLIQRFLKLLASEDVMQPTQVLAITFTRKATSEMRERVLRQLAAARAGAEPENDFDRSTRPLAESVLARDAGLAWNLLENPRRLNIRTIDSVCTEISGSLPVLSGSGGGQAPTAESAPLYAEAARRTMLLLGGDDSELTSALKILLLHRDGNLANCQALLAEMLAWREQWGALVPLSRHDLDEAYLDREVLPKLERALDLAICKVLTRVSKALPSAFLESLCALAAEMGHAEGYGGNPSPIALCAGRASPPEEKAAHVDHWRALLHLLLTKDGAYRKPHGIHKRSVAFLIEPAHRTELRELIERVRHDDLLRRTLCSLRSLPPNHYPAEQWVVAKALFRILSRGLVELQIVFAERQQCDFAEVGLLTASALRLEGGVQDLAASNAFDLQHLLVDEMQDTSSSQYELLQLLTQSFDGGSQTVFLVGDPKQSIYLFRQARVQRFLETMTAGRLGEVPLGTLHLQANFRSQRNLVDAFNQDFPLLFSDLSEGDQSERLHYLPATAVREASSQATRVWHIHPLPYSADTAEQTQASREQSKRRAADIRTIVEQWRRRPLPAGRTAPRTIAVLVRNRNHLLDVVQTFKQRDGTGPIPFRAVEIERLGERQEILDLFALTRALLHPADRTAWLAILRTPWCGLTLCDLHRLAGEDDPAYAEWTVVQLMEERGELLSSDGIRRLEHLWQVMRSAQDRQAHQSLSQRVAFLWRAFDTPTYATEEELANAERFFALLDELEQPGGRLDLTRLKERLERLYAAPLAHAGAVDLMTIHGAKGLEWDVVLVPALERVGQTTRGRLLAWMELERGGEDNVAAGMIAPIKSKGGAGRELNEWMRTIEATREAAELKRLFYVACTRAREELHLFAAPATNKDGGFRIATNSLLGAARLAFEAELTRHPGDVGEMPPLVEMPPPRQPLTLAAAATAAPLLQRIPLGAKPRADRPTPKILDAPTPQRSPGSFAARVFGNVMHAFLELLASRVAGGMSPEALAEEVPSWTSRVAATLRANGLPASEVDRLVATVVRGLLQTLRSEDGQWVLANHPSSATESAHISWREQRKSIRVDRSFLAGSEPRRAGTEYLWIVDYKTAFHGASGLGDFLAQERAQYAPQLEHYARTLEPDDRPVRLALFYPMLGELIWWERPGK